MLDTVEIKTDRSGKFKSITSSDSRISVIAYSKEHHDHVKKIFNEVMGSTGVYILSGSDDEGNKIYIGEGDSVLKRVENARHKHFNEEWVDNILFINSKDFSKTYSKDEIRYIESVLIEEANSNDNLLVQNGNTGQNPSIGGIEKYELDLEVVRVMLFNYMCVN